MKDNQNETNVKEHMTIMGYTKIDKDGQEEYKITELSFNIVVHDNPKAQAQAVQIIKAIEFILSKDLTKH